MDERLLWIEFHSIGRGWAREELLKLYDPFAKSIAVRMYAARYDDSVSFDDYLQYGRVGLLEAVERFDQGRGVPFSSFSGSRIRGAILNGIAKESEVAAQFQFWRGRVADRIDSLRASISPAVENATLDDLAAVAIGLAVGAVLDGAIDAKAEFAEEADPSSGCNPYSVNEFDQLAVMARKFIDQLPDRERFVIKSHYLERVEFQAIAHQLAVSKGRVSQLHAQAISRLRKWLESRPRLDGRF